MILKFRCIEDVVGFGEDGSLVTFFKKGNTYDHEDSCNDGFILYDETEGMHIIGFMGEEFFDKHFRPVSFSLIDFLMTEDDFNDFYLGSDTEVMLVFDEGEYEDDDE